MVIKLIIFLLGYFLIIPAFFYLKDSMSNKKRPAKLTDPNVLPLRKQISRWRTFGFKESSNKIIIIVAYIISIIISPIVSLFNILFAILLLLVLPWIFVLINKKLVIKEITEKDTLITRMLEFKRANMGYVSKDVSIFNYQQEFEILEYDKEDKKPSKLRIYLPVTFDPINKDSFIGKLSIQFGRGRPFELDETDKDYPGWDPDKGVATLLLVEPLPTKAMWKASYITHPDVQWSFFPLGLGSRGGLPIKDLETGEEIHLIGYDVDGAQKDYCDKNNIPVGLDIIASPHSLGAGVTGGGKSVSQNNIINSCLMRPNDWLLFGIDMKKVELGKLRRFGVPVATTYKDAADVATFVQKIMLDRFETMERLNINNWAKMPEKDRGPAIMLMVDEVSELLAPVKGKSEEAKQIAEYQEQTQAALESIARLGRAARVVMTIWGQRPDATVVSMQIRQNCPTRLASGNLPQTISQMVFESTEGNRVPGNPKGRMLIKTHSAPPIHFQGFFADSEWITEYLKENNLPMNVYEDNSTKGDFESFQNENAEDIEQEMSMAEFEEFTSL